MSHETEFRTLGPSSAIREGDAAPYYLADVRRRICVARVDGRLYAFDGLCTYAGCPLSAGLLTGTTLMCPCDASRFDITTGEVLNGPASTPLVILEVRERDGQLQIDPGAWGARVGPGVTG